MTMRLQALAAILLAAFMLGAGLASGAEPLAETTVTGRIVRAAQPVVMDGVLNEPVWQEAEPVSVDWIYKKQNEKSAQPRMTVRYAWDEHYLYIGYEVFDTNLTVQAKETRKGPADNRRQGCENWVASPQPQVDLAEFFPVFDENFFWETHHTANNLFNDLLIVRALPNWKKTMPAMASWPGIYFGREEFIKDEGEFKLAMATVLKPKADGKPSTVNDPSDTDTGYTAEIRLPWGGIGAPANARTKEGWTMAGRDLRILAVCQEGDAPELYFASATGLTPAFFHEQTGKYPRYVLVK
jgi:hypothetical protein